MRICLFNMYDNMLLTESDILVKEMTSSLSDCTHDIYFVTTDRWSKHESLQNLYPVSDSDELKMKVSRKLFKILGRNRWLPSIFGILPLFLAEKEILTTFLGCDPDVIVSPGTGCDRHIKKLLDRHYPHWHYLPKGGRMYNGAPAWRKYDQSVKVSIVLPTYNGSKYIRKSIESCLGQTHRNIELIIVDDGSRENTVELIAESYGDARIQYYRHEANLGLPNALNTGFQHTKGYYLTWTSDDNYYAPNAIEEMVRFLETYPRVDFVYAEAFEIDENDKVGNIHRNRKPHHLNVSNIIGACFLYKREVYEAVGPYNTELFLAEDYDYWLRISRHFTMQPLFKQLYFYRLHGDTLTAKYGGADVAEKTKLARKLNMVRER